MGEHQHLPLLQLRAQPKCNGDSPVHVFVFFGGGGWRLAARRSSSSGSRRIYGHGCNFFFLGVLREVWLELLSLYPLCTCLYFICFHVRCSYFGEATSRRRLHTGSHYTTPQEEYPPNLLATTATQIRLFPPLVTAARVVMHDGHGKPAALGRWRSTAHMVFF